MQHEGAGATGNPTRSSTRWARPALSSGAGVIVLLALTASAPSRAALPWQPHPALEARVDSLLRASTAVLHAGHLDQAAGIVDQAAAIAADDPRVHLFRFRVLRERFPDDFDEVERARAGAPALLAPLVEALACCNAVLARAPGDPAARLYRGWAHMMQAQVFALARQIGPAAEASGRGRDDLEFVLGRSVEPDPDAQVLLGGYLYFAATLPSIVKILQWLDLVPAGDAERGLELMRRGCSGDGYAGIDGTLVLAVVLYLFEGRIEEARVLFDRLAVAYPRNPRLAELRASQALVTPASTAEAADMLAGAIAQWGQGLTGWDPSLLHRLEWARARILRQAGRYEEAVGELRSLVDAAPLQPQWMMPQALLALATLERNLGRMDEAREHCNRLLVERRFRDDHDQARRIARQEPTADEVALFAELGAARRALFGETSGEPGERLARCREILERLQPAAAQDPRTRFVTGELELQAGRIVDAVRSFEAVADAEPGAADGDGGDLLGAVRLMALVRAAEVHIALGDCRAAMAAYRRARDLEPRGTLLGRIIRGRLRHLGRCDGSAPRSHDR